ncbi:MAG: hydantoinase B/oxoprolinase family protein [Verrucomicrobia bacterium]|nr:hydantoinase B/oxoprolinase family protein [Verrucomicrobiota bacterium]MDA1087857.1 hydantoinase B/oxoprolinase family protein [Verrucomicrobiota bacterium]
METSINPVTLEIMRNRWRGIAEEACAAMIRSSYSPNIRDRFDCSTALATPDGEIVAQAEIGTPLHLGIMPAIFRAVLERFPVAELKPGDAVITNLPYPEGPGHLPDLSMVSPVTLADDTVALVATTCHHVDMGGFAPGSMPFGVTEIYQEGLQIPPTKIFAGGEFVQPIYELINQNVRTRRELRGDLMAQWAAARTGQGRVRDLIERHGLDEVRTYTTAILEHAEKSMRAGIAAMPDGVYTYEDFLDDDGFVDEPVRIHATVTIAGDTLGVDFTGTSPQVAGPLNARLTAAKACVYYVAKVLIDPDLPSCAGAHRPITVTAPEGSLLQAHFPAAIGNANILTDQRVVDTLLGAFYQVVPDRVCAACSSEMNLINLGGIDPRSGEYFNLVETVGGGHGACHDLDGSDGIQNHLTNTQNTPIEVIERQYPVRIDRYELIPDSCGPGTFRGGCGIRRHFFFEGDKATLTIGADRRKLLPWGLEGGGAARGAYGRVVHADGTVEELPTKVCTTLRAGDTLCVETPGGGGWGDASERDEEAVRRDLADGLISDDYAATHHTDSS